MGAFADYLDEGAEVAPVEETPGQFQKGLRSGMLGAGSQLRALAGGVAEGFGMQDVAQEQFQGMRDLQARAQEAAPRITSYKDVGNLRDAYDYATGMVGQSVPVTATAATGALLAGRGAGGMRAVAGGAGMVAPAEVGDVIQRQQNDPVSMRASAAERMGDAFQYGGGSAVLQSVVPATIAGKLVGRAGASAANRSVGAILGQGVANTALEGATEGGGELVKQLGHMASSPDTQIDLDAIAENVVGGVAAGGPLAGVGVAADLARKGAAAPAKAAGEASAAGTDTAASIRDAFENAAGKAKDYVSRVAAGEDVADLGAIRGVPLEKVGPLLGKLDSERVQRVQAWADELATDAGLTPERREQLRAASADLTDRANQATIAALKRAKDAATAFGNKAKTMHRAFKRRPVDVEAREVDGTPNLPAVRKSEVFNDTEKAIAKALVPVLQRTNPDIFERGSEAALQDAAGALREMISATRTGGKDAVTSDQMFALLDTFGQDTVEVLDTVYKAVGGVNPQERTAFYEAVQRVSDAQAGREGLRGVLRKNLVDPEGTSDEVLDQVADGLRQRAIGRSDPNATPISDAERKVEDGLLETELKKYFGPKAGAVIDAVEKDVKAQQKANPLSRLKEDTEIELANPESALSARSREQEAETVEYGRYSIDETTGQDSYNGLEHIDTLDNPKSQAAQALVRARKENPGKNVEFLTAKQLPANHTGVKRLMAQIDDDLREANPDITDEEVKLHQDDALEKYGMVVAEGTRQETQLGKRDLHALKLKRKDGGSSDYKNPARLEHGGEILDAIKLTALMHGRFADDYTEADNKSGRHRAARMFMEGVAALQAMTGKDLTIPDSVQITKSGLTWGEAKKLDMTPPNAAADKADAKIAELRKEYAALRKTGAPDEALQEIVQQVSDIRDELIAMENFEQTTTQDGIGVHGRDYSKENTKALKETRRKIDSLETELNSPVRDNPAFLAKGREIMGFLEKRLTKLEKADRESVGGQKDTLQQERDPFGQVGQALRGQDKADAVIRTEASGNPRGSEVVPAKRLRNSQIAELKTKFAAFAQNGKSVGAKAIGARGMALMEITNNMSDHDHKRLVKLLGGSKASEVGETVASLSEKYKALLAKAEPEAKAAPKPEPKPEPAKANATTERIEQMLVDDDYEALDTKAKTDKFLELAYKRYGELMQSGEAKWDSPAFGRLAQMFDPGSTDDLGMFYEDFPHHMTDERVRAELAKAAPEVAAATRPKSDAAAYAATRKSAQTINRTTGTHTAADRAAVRAYVDTVLGPSVKVAFKNLLHAGEFEAVGADSIIRVSIHSLNPMSVGYHEALHAFIHKLYGQGNSEVVRTLERAAMSAPIQNQLKRLLAGESAALAQLRDPEEAAAYMYQFWAGGQLTVGGQTQTLFQKIAEAFRRVLGIWSNDQRALEIMEYFQRGEFKANMNNPGAVARALVASGRNQAIEQAKTLTKPLANLGEALMTVGDERLRGTGIPALRELADAMKLHGAAQGEDPGFLPAARGERARAMNDLADKLRGYDQAALRDALEAMQGGTKATTTQGRIVQRIVQGPAPDALLPRMLDYMRGAGVNVTALGVDGSYFPRVWNAGFIARHQAEFLTMLERYRLSGAFTGDPHDILQRIVASDGQEFTVETDRPGMQFAKKRILAFISDADAAPFVRKDLYEILNSYVTQATRRAEWARRFADDGSKLGALITKAKSQGATKRDLEAAQTYVRAVDGTLGDGLNPNARRIMGNMIVYQNIRLLPLAIFSSVVDPLGIVVRGGTVGDAFASFKRGVREVGLNFRKAQPPDAATKLAQDFGVVDDAMLLHAIGAVYSQGMVGDTGRKINDVFFRFNLMEQFNRSMRVGATQAALAFMARHADGTASPHSERWMAELGYAPGEYAPGAMDDKAKAAVNRWVDGAVLRPDAAFKPLWMSDPHFALFSHLKQFVFAFQQTILKRVAHEYRNGNYAPAMALTSYVPAMIAADLIKGMIQGGGETPEWKKDWGLGDYVGSGIERAGLLGVGQFAVDAGQHGPIGALTGPTVGQLWDGVKVAAGSKDGGRVVLKAMPANALYAGFAEGATDEVAARP